MNVCDIDLLKRPRYDLISGNHFIEAMPAPLLSREQPRDASAVSLHREHVRSHLCEKLTRFHLHPFNETVVEIV